MQVGSANSTPKFNSTSTIPAVHAAAALQDIPPEEDNNQSPLTLSPEDQKEQDEDAGNPDNYGGETYGDYNSNDTTDYEETYDETEYKIDNETEQQTEEDTEPTYYHEGSYETEHYEAETPEEYITTTTVIYTTIDDDYEDDDTPYVTTAAPTDTEPTTTPTPRRRRVIITRKKKRWNLCEWPELWLLLLTG